MHPLLPLVLPFVALMLLPTAALADIGPKPTIALTLPAELGALADEGSSLLLCKASDCSDSMPLESFGPQNFYCAGTDCRGMAYGFAPYLQLQLQLKDGRIVHSSIFTKKAFNATYTTSLNDGQLIVTETSAAHD